MVARTQFRAPATVRLADSDAERVRRAHDEKIRELQDFAAGSAAPAYAAAGTYLGRQVFTSSSTYTPATGCRRVVVRMVGGGGGGGGAAGGANAASGGGGGSGVCLEFHINSPAPITGGGVTIGAGGAGGTVILSVGQTGTAGGSTSLTINGRTYTATGGGGGGGMSSTTLAGVSGGSAVAGYTTSNVDAYSYALGQQGAVISSAGFAGDGGSSPFGGGGLAAHGAAGAGGDATGYGAGGGGGNASGANMNGGAGSAGIVIIDEWGSGQ